MKRRRFYLVLLIIIAILFYCGLYAIFKSDSSDYGYSAPLAKFILVYLVFILGTSFFIFLFLFLAKKYPYFKSGDIWRYFLIYPLGIFIFILITMAIVGGLIR
jgi:hypothetical protein